MLLSSSSLTKSQELMKQVNTDDVKNALEMLGVNIFKYDFSHVENDCQLKMYYEEFAGDSVISQKVWNFYNWEKDEQPKTLKIIASTANKDGKYEIRTIHPNATRTYTFDIIEKYREPHYWKTIKQEYLVYNKKTPLVFYGMSWEEELRGKKVRRFCWRTEITREMDNKQLEKVEHMILISYQLNK